MRATWTPESFPQVLKIFRAFLFKKYQGNVQQDYSYRASGPFQPRMESTTKRLLRETTEQLESSQKTVRKSYPYDLSPNQTDPNLTRRRIEPEIRPYGTPNQTQILGDASLQQPSNVNRSYMSAFEEYANAPKSLSRSGGVKTLRGLIYW